MSFLFANDERGRYPDSWYAASTDLPQPRLPLKGAKRTNVCIVGAGFTGLSAALHLAQAGMKVTVLDAHRVGFGASGRNGGQVGSGFNQDQIKLEKTMGTDAARHLWDMTQAAKALVRNLATAHAPDAGISAGVAHADFHASDTEDSHAYAAYLADNYGYDHIECLDRSGMTQIIKSAKYTGGTIDWDAFHLHPLRFATGLARAAEAAGVTIHENSHVHHIQRGRPATVQTDKGHVTADWVIHATNGYHTSLSRTQAARVMPINNYLVVSEPLDDPTVVLAKNIAVADNRFVLNYYRLSHDNRLIFGGGESYGKTFPKDIFAKVRKPMLEIFPQMKGVKLTHAWGGTLGITPTRLPLFTRIDATQLVASGFSGHGVALGTFAGKVMADVITGQTREFDVLSKLAVPPFPGGQALRTPIMALAMTWFALRDRIGL
ncbi:MAG: NAD(P)/FAD-dependent oxidoreductase [Planktomarina sp.]